jgi:hypothetical protein
VNRRFHRHTAATLPGLMMNLFRNSFAGANIVRSHRLAGELASLLVSREQFPFQVDITRPGKRLSCLLVLLEIRGIGG